MRAETAATILEHFGGSTWAKPDSKKHAEAAKVLEGFSHEDIVTACKSLRASLTRTHCKAEELVGEIKRNQRKSVVQARAMQEGIDPHEVEREAKQMRNTLLIAPREDIAKAVARCRKCAALDGSPLPADVAAWSKYQVGVVHSAVEANMESTNERTH